MPDAARPHTPSKPWPRGRMLTLQEVADELSVSIRTVRKWVALGRLQVIRITARTVRVPAQSLDALLERGRSTPR